jgi:hypothetical protein
MKRHLLRLLALLALAGAVQGCSHRGHGIGIDLSKIRTGESALHEYDDPVITRPNR